MKTRFRARPGHPLQCPLDRPNCVSQDRDTSWRIRCHKGPHNRDGSGALVLTPPGSNEFDIAWSPNGSAIAFACDRDGNNEIYLANWDGSHAVRLTNDTASQTQPTWSPDGTRIAFTTGTGPDQDVWVMNADGSGAVNLTSSNPGPDRDPFRSSLDYIWYVSTSRSGCCSDLWGMNPDGSMQAAATNDQAHYRHPQVAFDNTSIIYTSAKAGSLDVWKKTPNGPEVRLTSGPDADIYPAWSLDGTEILFTSNRNGSSQIFHHGSGRYRTDAYDRRAFSAVASVTVR